MSSYFGANYPPPDAGNVVVLVEPADVDRAVYVSEVRTAGGPEGPPVTHLDLHPDMDGGGFLLPERSFEFTLASGHGLHAAVSDPSVVDRIEVLVTPPHHR